jgi:hypothetical protein
MSLQHSRRVHLIVLAHRLRHDRAIDPVQADLPASRQMRWGSAFCQIGLTHINVAAIPSVGQELRENASLWQNEEQQ